MIDSWSTETAQQVVALLDRNHDGCLDAGELGVAPAALAKVTASTGRSRLDAPLIADVFERVRDHEDATFRQMLDVAHDADAAKARTADAAELADTAQQWKKAAIATAAVSGVLTALCLVLALLSCGAAAVILGVCGAMVGAACGMCMAERGDAKAAFAKVDAEAADLRSVVASGLTAVLQQPRPNPTPMSALSAPTAASVTLRRA